MIDFPRRPVRCDRCQQAMETLAAGTGSWSILRLGHQGQHPEAAAQTHPQRSLTRWAALKALDALRAEQAAEPIAARLTTHQDRPHARDALIALGPLAEKAVIAKLSHDDWWVRLEACNVLKSIGTKDSLPGLEKGMSDSNGLVRGAAEQAVKAIGDRE